MQIRNAIADIMIALIVGAFWALAFEYPGINIEQAIFNNYRSKRQLQDKKGALSSEIPEIKDFVTDRS